MMADEQRVIPILEQKKENPLPPPPPHHTQQQQHSFFFFSPCSFLFSYYSWSSPPSSSSLLLLLTTTFLELHIFPPKFFSTITTIARKNPKQIPQKNKDEKKTDLNFPRSEIHREPTRSSHGQRRAS